MRKTDAPGLKAAMLDAVALKFTKTTKSEKYMKHKNNAKTRWCIIVIALALTSALVSSALGQETSAPAADPMAAFKTDKGLISLTKVAPELTPVSDYTGDFWSRATLFGDPGGWRTRLYDHGLTLDGQLTQVYQGVTSGGSTNGKGHGQYNGLFEANLTLDTAKAGLWSGGLFLLTEQTSFGTPLQTQAGNLSPINATALWPKAYDDSSVLMEYLLVQALPLNTVALVGRLDPSKYLDQNSFACNSDKQFLNVSMNSNPLFGRFLTYSVYAAIFMTKVTEDFTLAYGAWTPNSQPAHYGGDWNDYGAAIYPMFKYKAFKHPGMVQVIAAYTSKNAVDVDNPRFVPGAITGNPPTKSDNWIVELSGEQYFWEPEGALVPQAEGGRKEDFHVPTKDFVQDRPGLGIFYRFSSTPKDRSAYDIYLSGGVGGRGVIPGRPHDRLGVGSYWLKESSDLSKQPGNLLRDEVGVEAFYNFAITPYLQLSLDAQWISPGIRSSDDALVLGTRLNIRF
jgi:porin